MASVYQFIGKLDKALELSKSALTVMEKVLGREHPHVAVTYRNIGALYWQQGQYSETLDMFKKCLKIEEKTYGSEHPVVADTKTCPQQYMSYMKLCMFLCVCLFGISILHAGEHGACLQEAG